MRIESLSGKPDRAGRFLVKFEDGSTMRLYRQTLEDHALYAGKELTPDEMKTLRNSAGAMSAKMRAVRIVSASNISRDDLQQRLVRKGEDPRQAEAAVQWMEDLRLVDDRRTAEEIVHRCATKGYGLSRAKQALYEKRIPKEYWDDALSDYPDQSEHILAFLHSRLGKEPDEKEIKRTIDALIRRGHGYNEIRSCLCQFIDDADNFVEEE
jgi:regulatory protein